MLTLRGAICALALSSAACAAHAPATVARPVAQTPVAVAEPAPAPLPARPPSDPVVDLIAVSTRHFEAGQKELQDGHLERAKTEFNRALDVLLESPFGARTEPRIREHFDRLVERISAYEVTALSQGDGFTEKKYEPASIDELLAISTFPPAPSSPETAKAIAQDIQSGDHDIDIPLNDRVLSVRRAVHGPAEGLPRGRLEPRRAVPADDSGGLPRRGSAAGPGLRAAGRERVQDRAPCPGPTPRACGSS